ncbi:SDR family NAD(P)-dependent oxidoreductase [Actinosynnema sp. NPDC023587]|uniref:SDR family NAD(P)-dependent oxidoreductase n=1 Tax=Actinosynnema sp. NPDC023587 TaxID=3154695 RepID=UPI0034040AA5
MQPKFEENKAGFDQDPVAVIGMGCRLPGGISSPEGLWRALTAKLDLVGEVPPDRWNAQALYDPDPGVPGKSVSSRGGFVDDVTGFDAEFFRISRRDAEAMDPQHRILLEVAWEALENAGVVPAKLAGSSTGVFVGTSTQDYHVSRARAALIENEYTVLGTSRSMASGRISYALDLRGPSATVDTACSSSLVATDLAYQALANGRCDLAVVGGVQLLFDPDGTAGFSRWGALSPAGQCRSFAAGALGFVRSEGCGVVILRRLADAVRERDRVLAVIRGSGVNQDGRTEGITVPSRPAQEALIREVVRRSGIDPRRVGLLEAHGTGTPTGDPIEFAALSAVYGAGEMPAALGSIKTNIGHCEAAAGVAGLIKAVLALRYGKIPANLHFDRWNPDIDADSSRLFVPTALTDWPTVEEPRLATVSSYGISGVNAHMVLEQAPAVASTPPGLRDDRERVYPVSASSPRTLALTARLLAEWLDSAAGREVPLDDVGATLALRRAPRTVRAAVVASDRSGLVEGLVSLAEQKQGPQVVASRPVADGVSPVWLFSGHGSQWAGMGVGLLRTEAAFAEAIAELEPVILAESGLSVRDALTSTEGVTGFARVQPVLFALQVGLAAVWRAHGVAPAAVIGHSLGEVAAAVAAGGLSPTEGAIVVCRRSMLASRVAGLGAMGVVNLAPSEVATELSAKGIKDVVVAVETSPGSTVVSGEAARVRALLAEWEARDLFTREVAVDVASHSPQIDPIIDDMNRQLADLSPQKANIPFYSTVHPGCVPRFDGTYWVDNMRLPVRLSTAVKAALADGHRLFLELSPHPLLINATEEIATQTGVDIRTVPSLRRGAEPDAGLGQALAAAHCAGVAVDWTPDHDRGDLADVPLAPWEHSSLKLTSRDEPSIATTGGQPLLGAHAQRAARDGRHYWQAEAGTDRHPWLADHRVLGHPVMPLAGFVEMALAAAAEIHGEDATVDLEDIAVHDALPLDDRVALYTEATESGPGLFTIDIATRASDGEAVRHASMSLRRVADHAGETVGSPSPPPPTDMDHFYAAQQDRGVDYGPMFQAVVGHTTQNGDPDRLLATIALPAALRIGATGFRLHPVLLDGCLQLIYTHPKLNDPPSLYLPVRVGRIRVLADPHRARFALLDVRHAADRECVFDARMVANDGTVLVEVLDVRVRAADTGHGSKVMSRRLMALDWESVDTSTAQEAQDRSIVVISEDEVDPLTAAVTAGLAEYTRHTDLVPVPLHDPAARLLLRARLADDTTTDVVVACPQAGASGVDPDSDTALKRVIRLVEVAQVLTERARPPRLWLISHAAQHVVPADAVELEQAGLRGLAHVIGNEHPELGVTHLDLDAVTHEPGMVVDDILTAPTSQTEIAHRGGRRYLARLHHLQLTAAHRLHLTPDPEHDGVALRSTDSSEAEIVTWGLRPRREPERDEVEVEVHAVALTTRDLELATRRVHQDGDRLRELGMDYAGVVRRIGDSVTRLRPGDRVAGLWPGSLASHLVVPAAAVLRVPDGLSTLQAATVPAAALTARYALSHVARVRAGERVLVHPATGQTGLAAAALARTLGAEVICTAVTDAERQALRDQGVSHVLDTHAADLVGQVRELTGGHGIDVVINTSSGLRTRAEPKLLASCGRFVEVGMRDGHAADHLDLSSLRRRAITLAVVDPASVVTSNSSLLAELVEEAEQDVTAGHVSTSPVHRYPPTEIDQAFRDTAPTTRAARAVVDLVRDPGGESARITVPLDPQEVAVVRRDSTYLITGGLGGIGLHVARWLADNAAGRIVLNGRSTVTVRARQAVDELRAEGHDVRIILGDLTIPGVAQHLVDECLREGMRLGGIVHATMVVADGTLPNITPDLIERAWRCKVDAAWLLHHASAPHRPAWWVSFSSLTTVIGNPGQGPYCAANGWLEGFTHWRRSRGLRTQHISFGAWAGHGRGAHLSEQGVDMIEPEEGIAVLEHVLRHDHPAPCYGPLTVDGWLANLGSRALETTLLAPLAASERENGDSASKPFLDTLAAVDTTSRGQLLVRRIVDHVASCLSVDPSAIGAEQPFAAQGIDSLTALELRNRISRDIGIRLPPKDIMRTYNTPARLGTHLERLLEALQTPHPSDR